jgi:ribonuclease HI
MMLKLFVDGGVHGGRNPGTGVYWSVGKAAGADGLETEIVSRSTIMSQYTTNNEAEYLALNDALQYAASLPVLPQRVMIHSDSQLIVNQFNGSWTCGKDTLRPLLSTCRRNAEWLKGLGVDVDVVWVRREVSVRRLGH